MQNGATPLLVSSHNGHTKVVEFLLRAGANIKAATNERGGLVSFVSHCCYDIVFACLSVLLVFTLLYGYLACGFPLSYVPLLMMTVV